MVQLTEAMTPDTTIEQQAIREACDRYANRSTADKYVRFEIEAYAAALIAERSKPQPSVEELRLELNKELAPVFQAMDWGQTDRAYSLLRKVENSFRDRLANLFNK